VNPFVARRTLRRTPVKADALPRSPQGPNAALMHTIPQTPPPAASSPATCPLVRLPGEKLLRTPVHAPTSHVAIPPMPTALTVTPAPLPLPLPSAQTPDAIPRTPGTTLLASRAHTPAAQVLAQLSLAICALSFVDPSVDLLHRFHSCHGHDHHRYSIPLATVPPARSGTP
jgi:hypothetical protein